jgi:hypothetical protein
MPSKQSHRRLKAKGRQAASELRQMHLAASVSVDVDGSGTRLPSISINAYNGGTMRPGGMFGNVIVDLQGVRKSDGPVPLLLGHDHSQIVGHAIVAITDRIQADGVISGTGPAAMEVIGLAKNGFPWKASIGLGVERAQYLDDEEEVNVNGQMVTGPITVVRQSLLGEISVLPWAADQTTTVTVAASQSSERSPTTMDEQFVMWLELNGFDENQLSEKSVKMLEAAWKADKAETPENRGLPPPARQSDPLGPQREMQAAETVRVGEIRKVCAGQHVDLEAQAIREGWDPVRVELHVLRDERSRAPAIHVASHESPAGHVLEAACAMAGGLDDIEEAFDAKILEAANKRYRQGIGLQELLLESAWANGYQGRRFRGEMEDVMRAAFSTKSLSGILGNTANKFLLTGFMNVEDSWRQISATRSVNDFKTATSYRLTGDLQFIEVGPTGEIKHGEVDESSYTNQAKTYARMFSISRTDLINDDLGALTSIPRRIGRGAALKLNDVFWTAFMDNSSFFTSGRANYISGSTTNLAVAGLTAGVLAFRKLNDPDGKPLGMVPRILLVPPDLEVLAEELFVSTNINTGGAATLDKVPNRNVFAAKYRPVVSQYLSNASYTGYSVTAWYLLADPNDMATIEVAFLNGRQTPVVESADADFNTLGIQLRGYFDFGAAKTEYLAGVMSKGAS